MILMTKSVMVLLVTYRETFNRVGNGNNNIREWHQYWIGYQISILNKKIFCIILQLL